MQDEVQQAAPVRKKGGAASIHSAVGEKKKQERGRLERGPRIIHQRDWHHPRRIADPNSNRLRGTHRGTRARHRSMIGVAIAYGLVGRCLASGASVDSLLHLLRFQCLCLCRWPFTLVD